MRTTSQLVRCLRPRLRFFGALAALIMLTGCGVNGDFGEINRVLVQDEIHDWIGRDKSPPPSEDGYRFQLTDDERAMRHLAYPLIEPPYNRHKLHSVISEYGMTPQILKESADPAVYYMKMMSINDRSSAARYSQLIDDIRNDITRLPAFSEVAFKVVDLDTKRRKSMAFVRGLSENEKNESAIRVRENARVVSLVSASMNRRVASYRYALERFVIMIPSPQAADAERVLKQLQALIAYYRAQSTPPFVAEPSLASTN
jgi:hypothetical protein